MPELFGFQAKGLAQIQRHQWEREQTGNPDRSVLIGDDMGLGKTVEAIVLDLTYRNSAIATNGEAARGYKTLVVTMTSVMGAWEKHYATWAPHLKVLVVNRKNRAQFEAELRKGSASEYHVFVCHWQALRFIDDALKTVYWFHIIGDEIHNIKNRKAQQSWIFKKLKTVFKTGLSGTWADNKPDDAWSVLNWLWPKTWTSYWTFFNYHVLQKKHNEGTCLADGCDGYHKRAYTEIIGMHDAESIHRTMGGAYLRRKKEHVWEDMPEKTTQDFFVDLDPKQRRTYDQMEKDMLAWVGAHEDEPLPAPSVISQLVRLQQFAVAYGKLEIRYKDGQPSRYLVLDEPSSKLDATMDLIGATNAQVVVFGQSKQAIHLLEARLLKAKIPHGVLTGDVAQKDRDQRIEDFQSGRTRVFCSTIKAGGVGITLTAASVCIFLDWDWSPTKNRQAEDRLHRLGQKNAVYIIRLVARGTIDSARNQKIEMKWSWLKELLDPKQRVA